MGLLFFPNLKDQWTLNQNKRWSKNYVDWDLLQDKTVWSASVTFESNENMASPSVCVAAEVYSHFQPIPVSENPQKKIRG